MRHGCGLLVVAALGLGLAGCAEPVGGDARPGLDLPRSTSSAPRVDPNSREARWMNDLCGVGKLLVTAGQTQPKPQVSDDPAVLRREFSDTTGRLASVLDAALTDLNRLVPAPVGGLDDVINTVVGHMTAAHGAVRHAKSTVDASDPLTVDAYTAAINEFGRGLASMQKALDFLKLVDLPEELTDAATAAPNCGDGGGFPVGER